MPKPSIVVVGSINADVTVNVARHPLPGETLLGTGNPVTAGGKGANQAVAAALLGGNVTLVGAVGKDAYAEPATEFLRTAQVNLAHVEAVEDVTGMAMITVAEDGENTIIVVPGANAHVTAEYVARHADIIQSAAIVVLQGEIPADGFAEAVRLARGRVVINLAPVVEVNPAALLQADPLLANEHEAGLILAQLGAEIPSSDPEDMVQALLDAGFESVVLTLGSKGSLVGENAGITPISTPTVTSVDSVGAGDAFGGALCYRLAEGDTLVEAAAFASRVGAYAVTQPGAQASYPTSADHLPG